MQVADQDALLAVGGELRPVRGDRRVDVQLAPVDQHQRGQAGHRLGRRPDVGDGVLGPRDRPGLVAEAAPQVDDDLAVDVHDERRAEFLTRVQVPRQRARTASNRPSHVPCTSATAVPSPLKASAPANPQTAASGRGANSGSRTVIMLQPRDRRQKPGPRAPASRQGPQPATRQGSPAHSPPTATCQHASSPRTQTDRKLQLSACSISPYSVLEVCQVQLSCVAPISVVPVRSPSQPRRGVRADPWPPSANRKDRRTSSYADEGVGFAGPSRSGGL